MAKDNKPMGFNAYPKPIYTATEVGEMLGVNPTALGWMCDSGMIASRKIGKKRIIGASEIALFLEETEGETISTASKEDVFEAAARIRKRAAQKAFRAMGGIA